jgi:hypothetical protein
MKYDRWWGRRRDIYAVYIHCAVNPSISVSRGSRPANVFVWILSSVYPSEHCDSSSRVVVVLLLLWFQRTKRAQTKTEKPNALLSLSCVLCCGRPIYFSKHTHTQWEREANTQVRRCVVLFDTAQLLAQILFCFCFFVKFYLLRCWHDVHTDSRNSFLIHTGAQENRFL